MISMGRKTPRHTGSGAALELSKMLPCNFKCRFMFGTCTRIISLCGRPYLPLWSPIDALVSLKKDDVMIWLVT